MTMSSINGCLLLLLSSMASLASTQPMSLNEPLQPQLSCNFLTCTGAILGKLQLKQWNKFGLIHFCFSQGQLRLAYIPGQPRRWLTVSRTSWRASVRETARPASATSSLSFVRRRILYQLRQTLRGRRLCLLRKNLTPVLRQRKILSWIATFSHALAPSWVRSNLNTETIFLSLTSVFDSCGWYLPGYWDSRGGGDRGCDQLCQKHLGHHRPWRLQGLHLRDHIKHLSSLL